MAVRMRHETDTQKAEAGLGMAQKSSLGFQPRWLAEGLERSRTRAVTQEVLDPVHLLIIQPTPFCNINCSYCYLGDRSDKKQITLGTVEAIARFLRDVPVSASPLAVCWHAGEPLVVPVAFYEQAFNCFAQTPGAPAVQHSFQTNATLIDDKWCDLFKRWSVRVGVSVDGPRTIHDANRVDRAGRGTFDRVMRGSHDFANTKCRSASFRSSPKMRWTLPTTSGNSIVRTGSPA